MNIHLIAAGNRMPEWVQQGFAEYARRLPAECRLQLVEIPVARRGKSAVLSRLLGEEAKRICAAIPKGALVVALDQRGAMWDTPQLAAKLKGWLQGGRDVALLVGGPDGLAPECLARADGAWSLSPLTLPHPLVRIVVAEQLYRGWSILQNHPYHR